LTPICTKSFVGCGFAPNPTWGACSSPADSLAVFRGPSKGRGGGDRTGGEMRGWEREKRGRERREMR